MKDGTAVHMYTLDDWSKDGYATTTWVIQNPGRQMFTGSFHPLEDTEWEDRASWDSRVNLEEPNTIVNTFRQRRIVKFELIKRKVGGV